MVPFFLCGSCFGKRNQPSASRSPTTSQASHGSAAASSTGSRSLSSTSWMFSLMDLRSATNDFSTEAKLGQGGFGTVYKGTLQDGREIAVKKLSVGSRQGKQEFLNEVRLLTTVHHRNLIKLYGCCVEESERILVYEYLRNRSLDKHLFDPAGTKLDWHMRRSIILGTAKGLSYLHEYSRLPMVHRDIKPGNILLDDHFLPKIADFGLARLFTDDQTHISSQATAGTLGYLAPEYAYHGKLSKKVDVFSFGVVVLEIISGRRNGQELLLDLAWRLYEEDRLLELLDLRILTNDESAGTLVKEVVQMGRVALLCTQAEPSLRPPMSNVVLLLSGKSSIKQVITRPAFVGMPLGSSLAGSSSSGGSSTAGTGASVVGNLQRVSPSHMQQQGSLDKGRPLFLSSNFTYDCSEIDPR